MAKGKQKVENAKVDELGVNREEATDEYLTTNQGLRINDDQNSLKAGERGPSLLADFFKSMNRWRPTPKPAFCKIPR